MNRISAKLALAVVLCTLLCPWLNESWASSGSSQQGSDIVSLSQLAIVYRQRNGAYPKTDNQSTWFQKLVSDDPTVAQYVHFGLIRLKRR